MSKDNPRWLEKLGQELGLGDTPAPEESDDEISVVDAIEKVDFSREGWARVRELILKADEDTDISLFHRIMSASDDDAMMFTAMVGLPYYLSITLGHDKKLSKRMATFVAASYVIAMRRGYVLGQEDAKED